MNPTANTKEYWINCEINFGFYKYFLLQIPGVICIYVYFVFLFVLLDKNRRINKHVSVNIHPNKERTTIRKPNQDIGIFLNILTQIANYILLRSQ